MANEKNQLEVVLSLLEKTNIILLSEKTPYTLTVSELRKMRMLKGQIWNEVKKLDTNLFNMTKTED